MKTLLFLLLFVGLLDAQQLDSLPELRTLDGKVYKAVRVMKTDAAEIRIAHDGGFAVIALSKLPPEVLQRYTMSRPDPRVEQRVAAERAAANAAARPPAAVPTVAPSPGPGALPTPAASAQKPTALDYLAEAIRLRKRLVITYDNDAEGARLIEPHLLGVNEKREWMLSAWFVKGASKSSTGEGWRLYLLSKMQIVQLTDETFAPREGYDPDGAGLFAAWWKRVELQQAAAPQLLREVGVDTIDGEFTGFEDGRTFKMMSGLIWRQTGGEYLYHYAYCPQVTFYPGKAGLLMKVEGVEGMVPVIQVIK